MTDRTPDIIFEETLEFLTRQAAARWGDGYVSQHQDLLEQTARQIVNVGNNLPETETEPGFYQ
jgi:hypothetical protein